MRSYDLEQLQQGCRDYLHGIGAVIANSMSIRRLLSALLLPDQAVFHREISQFFESWDNNISPILDESADHLDTYLQSLISFARVQEQQQRLLENKDVATGI